MKPSFTVFAGVGSEGLSDDDVSKLPPEIRCAYSLIGEYDPGQTAKVDGLEFDSFDLGREDSADPGGFAGFGVHIFGQWFDEGVTEFESTEIVAGEKILQKVDALFRQWGLSVPARLYCFTGHNS